MKGTRQNVGPSQLLTVMGGDLGESLPLVQLSLGGPEPYLGTHFCVLRVQKKKQEKLEKNSEQLKKCLKRR